MLNEEKLIMQLVSFEILAWHVNRFSDVCVFVCACVGVQISDYSGINLWCLFWFKTIDIVIPEFDHMRLAHVVSIGSEAACGLCPDYEAG